MSSAGSALRVRAAVLADADQVWPLVQQLATSFVVQHRAFGDAFGELVSRDDTLLAVAEMSGELVGYALAVRHPTLFANAPVVWVEEILVTPFARRRGVGAALMTAVEDWAGAGAAAYVSLATRRADSFYLALGYEPSATFYRKLQHPADPG